MGYFAQRKRRSRINFILKSLIIVFGLFSLLAFTENSVGCFLNQWRFQYYLLFWGVMLYALVNRFWLYALSAVFLLLLNFFAVSSSVSILPVDREDENRIDCNIIYQQNTNSFPAVFEAASKYQAAVVAVVNPQTGNGSFLPAGYHLAGNGEKGSFMAVSVRPKAAGKINLGQNSSAVFSRLEISGKDHIFLSMDLSSLSRKDKERALDYINAFVAAQDDPVIVFGNFGMTAWSPAFGRFLGKNRLEVKNSVFSLLRNLFLPPVFYVVGYRNLDFVGSRMLPAANHDSPPVLFMLKV